MHFLLLCHGIDEGGQLDVVHAEPLAVVRGQCHLDPVVDVEPLGMVVHLVRLYRHARHKAERLVKVGECKGLLDGVPPALDHLPAALVQQRRKVLAAARVVQLGRRHLEDREQLLKCFTDGKILLVQVVIGIL
jgi:hypothetical protein